MPKQPHHVLQIESKPQMDFLSYLYRFNVNFENNFIAYTKHCRFIFRVIYRPMDSHNGLSIPRVGITSMIAHGHGNVKFIHYALDLYLTDSNHTIGSFARLSHDMGKPSSSSLISLFENTGWMPLYEAVLHGKDVITIFINLRFFHVSK